MDQPADIRQLSAGRGGHGSVIELRSREQLRPDLNEVIEPIRRSFGRPQVVIREHTNNAVRWKHGERLNHLIEAVCVRFAANDAVITDSGTLSYRDLNRRANQVARHLIDQGVRSGDRVGLLFDKSPETYVAMLAVMKINAAYVPLDVAFPIERIGFIVADAEIAAIVSVSSFAERLSALDTKKIFLDFDRHAIDTRPADPLTEVAPPVEPLC
jgi:non-ribosomal peptide synthetase component F